MRPEKIANARSSSGLFEAYAEPKGYNLTRIAINKFDVSKSAYKNDVVDAEWGPVDLDEHGDAQVPGLQWDLGRTWGRLRPGVQWR